MATARGLALTPGTVETIDVPDARTVTITSDGSAAVRYTLDGSTPTTASEVLPGSVSKPIDGGTVKLLADKAATVTVVAYSSTEAEATSAGTDAHAALQAGIDAAEATGQNARQMVLSDRPKLDAVMVTAAAADDAHASLQEQIDAVQLTPGPQGPPGPQGNPGPAGPQGTQGPAGVIAGVVKQGSLALTGTLAASASGSYTVTLPDMGGTTYHVAATLEGTTALLDKLTVAGVVSKTATTCVVRVRNTTTTTNLSGVTLQVLATRVP